MRRHFAFVSLSALLFGCQNASEGYIVFNTPPAVSILEPIEDDMFEEDEAIVFRGIVADDDPLDTLVLQWTSSIDGELESFDVPDDQGFIELATADLSIGSHVITLRATDFDAAQGEARVTVHVEGVPDHPELEIVHPQVGEDGLEGWPFQFMVRVSDHQDIPGDLLVEVVSDTFGPVCLMVPDSNGVGTCDRVLPNGQHLLTFSVEDLDGFVTSQNRVFEVVAEGDYDADGDGFTPNGGDCNDNNAQIYPGAPEICDGFDNDCNPATAIDVGTVCYDDDGDGFCESPPCVNTSETLPDCNDAAPYICPDEDVCPEILDGFDNNCDGRVDEGTVVYDDDGDGFCESPPCVNASGTQSDCNDDDSQINPGMTESCNTAYDDDCNGLSNEQNATACNDYWYDGDSDGYYPNGASRECWCDGGNYPYTATLSGDCDDANYDARPGQTQYFTYPRSNGSYDYNCNFTEERWVTTTTNCYFNASSFSCDSTGQGGVGWTNSVPSCGGQGTYVDDCDYDLTTCLIICGLTCTLGTEYDCISCIQNSCLSAGTCDPDGAENRLQACR